MTRLLTTREVVAMLGLSPATVLRHAGELGGYRIASNCLRFDPATIDAWLAERRLAPTDHDDSAILAFANASQHWLDRV